MKYLLFNWEEIDDIGNPDELTDEQFEQLAEEYGIVIESSKAFEEQFNAEMFSVHTHQLRIIPD